MLLRLEAGGRLHVGVFQGSGTWTSRCTELEKVELPATGNGWVERRTRYSFQPELPDRPVVMAWTDEEVERWGLCRRCLAAARRDALEVERLALVDAQAGAAARR